MKIIVTGTPGVGKTSVSKVLAKKLKLIYVNEKDFSLKHKVGKLDKKSKEVLVEPKKLEKSLNNWLLGQESVLVEGHILCELRLKVDFVVLLTAKPAVIEKRLEKKGFSQEKVLDNVFCEEIGFCKRFVYKNYVKNKVIEVKSEQSIKSISNYIVSKVRAKSRT